MRKKKVADKNWQEELEDLAELAGKRNVPDGFLEDALWDACESEARLQHEDICGKVLLDQLEFLFMHGYQPERLREMIQEAVEDKKRLTTTRERGLERGPLAVFWRRRK